MDYLTLTTQGESIQEKNANGEKARKILKNIDTSNNIAIFQYDMLIDEARLARVAESYANRTEGAFVKYAGRIGKIKRIDESESGRKWIFMKKGAKTRGYYLNDWNIYQIKNENE